MLLYISIRGGVGFTPLFFFCFMASNWVTIVSDSVDGVGGTISCTVLDNVSPVPRDAVYMVRLVDDTSVSRELRIHQDGYTSDSANVELEDGKVVSYVLTESVSLADDSYVDTGFVPFDGGDFYIHLKATFPSGQASFTNLYPTILNAMNEVSPYNGFVIRRELLRSGIQFVHQSRNWTITTEESFDIEITKVGNTISVTGTNSFSFDIDYDIAGLTITLGCSVDSDGSPYRYADCTIDEFEVRRI